ncbi:hybrid sensor histidine kinase/response regulator [Sphingomonas abietis]|uniref:histidine kinase n=1 Tax=Sphingomonas abietis TaxID=3012344 RepID=A0ABY7NS86_9SPHN|nr:PAS domain-containing sensor histidine kinase [Sphingomonas abietis]WBO24370.1 PAS domain S-box protein [Sphingomonas abietis]
MTDPSLAQDIIDSSTDFAIITLDPEGLITSWNSGAEHVLGWSAEEAIGQHGRLFFTKEDQAAGSPEHEIQRARREGRALNERTHMRADGSRFWGSGLLMRRKGSPGFVKIVRDRTHEREAERRLASLMDALPGFVFEADTDGHYVQTNARYQDYTGRAHSDLLGDGWLEVVHPDHRSRTHDAWKESIRTGRSFEQTFLVAAHDGSYRCFACRGIPEAGDDGRVLRWIGTCIDVENEAKARAMLEGLNLSLEHAVTNRSAALEESHRALQSEVEERERIEEALRQSQKMEAIGQLTGGVAHDFNNLLTVILGSVDLLRRPNLSDEKRERYMSSIAETAERAAKLTNQLLAFARRQPLKAEAFDVVKRLGETGNVLQTVSGARVTIDLDVRCESCLIEADPVQFDTAMLNMAVNARDAMDGEGTLTITVEERACVPPTRGHGAVAGRFVAVSVRDTGAGIAHDDLPRIFEPFFTTKEVGRGTGLGLSQVFGFAKQSGGEIAIDSAPGRGAVFTLYLPHAEDKQKASAAPAETTPTAVTATGSGQDVLLVEDNQLVGEFAAQLIGDLGYTALWVSSAQEALALVEANPGKFDIVFTDVVMPGMSGIELAEALREKYPKLPVVLTSGYSHVLAAEGTHGFDLLQKPYTADGLAHALQKAAQSRK